MEEDSIHKHARDLVRFPEEPRLNHEASTTHRENQIGDYSNGLTKKKLAVMELTYILHTGHSCVFQAWNNLDSAGFTQTIGISEMHMPGCGWNISSSANHHVGALQIGQAR